MKKIFLLYFAFACLGAGCATGSVPARPPVPPPIGKPPVACTMEAKQCPDGSSVGRSGPNCEFAPCPTPGVEGRRCTGTSDSSCGKGYECSQDCGPPVAREGDAPPGYSCHVIGKPRMCPICLASNTMIATPNGDVNIKDIKIGMSVWTKNTKGQRITGRVIRLSKTPVSKTHNVIQLVMSDKRILWVSPGHPLVNGRPVSELRPGDRIEGVSVFSVDLVPYWDDYTYDILAEGGTGSYWANGVLMGSTLFGH